MTWLLASIIGGQLLLVTGLIWALVATKSTQVTDAHGDAMMVVDNERLTRERDQFKAGYEAARLHAANLREALRDALSKSDLGAGLAADDWRTRMLRLYETWAVETAAADGGDGGEAVPTGEGGMADRRSAPAEAGADGGPVDGPRTTP